MHERRLGEDSQGDPKTPSKVVEVKITGMSVLVCEDVAGLQPLAPRSDRVASKAITREEIKSDQRFGGVLCYYSDIPGDPADTLEELAKLVAPEKPKKPEESAEPARPNTVLMLLVDTSAKALYRSGSGRLRTKTEIKELVGRAGWEINQIKYNGTGLLVRAKLA